MLEQKTTRLLEKKEKKVDKLGYTSIQERKENNGKSPDRVFTYLGNLPVVEKVKFRRNRIRKAKQSIGGFVVER